MLLHEIYSKITCDYDAMMYPFQQRVSFWQECILKHIFSSAVVKIRGFLGIWSWVLLYRQCYGISCHFQNRPWLCYILNHIALLLLTKRAQSTDHELIPARNASLVAMQVSASGSNVRYNPTWKHSPVKERNEQAVTLTLQNPNSPMCEVRL
jgi:hypothetical protein